MAATIDELTVSYTEDGIETVKELDKKLSMSIHLHLYLSSANLQSSKSSIS